jgi:hypothetical protein
MRGELTASEEAPFAMRRSWVRIPRVYSETRQEFDYRRHRGRCAPRGSRQRERRSRASRKPNPVFGPSATLPSTKQSKGKAKPLLNGCNGALWPIGPYNTQHETDHRGDAHIPGSPWLNRFISPETVAGRGVEKRRIWHGVRHSGSDAKVLRGDRYDLCAWRCGPA